LFSFSIFFLFLVGRSLFFLSLFLLVARVDGSQKVS